MERIYQHAVQKYIIRLMRVGVSLDMATKCAQTKAGRKAIMISARSLY